MHDGDESGSVLRFGRAGDVPVRPVVRSARLASIPLGFAGRRVAATGKRMIGRPRVEVNAELHARTARHMFEVLGELRACAAKLGQFMSIYELVLPDQVAAPYRVALSQLQESTPAMLPKAVHAVLAEQLGEGWRGLFRDFDDRHAAAASLGQVHRAVWNDGRTVAVKLMYPGAREAVAGDLRHLKRVSWLASPFLSGADIRGIVDELCLRITDELNYELEAANQRRFAAAYAGSADFLVPAVVHQSGDVLITEWVDGKPLSQVIANGHQRERDRVGELFLRFNLTGPARCGLFYGDPHPGNYRVTADGRLAVFDFGACAEPPLGFTEMAADLLAGIVGGNPETMAANARRYGFVAPGVDLDAAALADELGLFREALVRPTFRFTTKWLRSVVLHVSQLHLSNVNRQLTLPARLTPIGRTFVAGAGVLCQIGGEVRVRDAVLTLVPEFAGEANTAPITSIRSSGID